jgi:hypothetical protein
MADCQITIANHIQSPIAIMESAHDWALLSNWLASTAEILFKLGDLFSQDELIIARPGNTSGPAASLETCGDAWFTQFAGTWVTPQLKESLNWAIQGESARWQEARLAALSHNIVKFMVANKCGLGPWMAELLGLRRLFNTTTTGMTVNPEVAAGLFEQYIGGLERRGYLGCIKALTLFMWSTMMAIARLQATRVDARQFLSCINVDAWAFTQGIVGIDMAWTFDLASLQGYPRDWKEMIGNIIGQGTETWRICKELQTLLVREIFLSSQHGVDGALVECASSSSNALNAGLTSARQWELLHPHHPDSYRLHLECGFCRIELLTEYGRGGQPYEHAKRLGWSKIGKTWQKSKCCNCHD